MSSYIYSELASDRVLCLHTPSSSSSDFLLLSKINFYELTFIVSGQDKTRQKVLLESGRIDVTVESLFLG